MSARRGRAKAASGGAKVAAQRAAAGYAPAPRVPCQAVRRRAACLRGGERGGAGMEARSTTRPSPGATLREGVKQSKAETQCMTGWGLRPRTRAATHTRRVLCARVAPCLATRSPAPTASRAHTPAKKRRRHWGERGREGGRRGGDPSLPKPGVRAPPARRSPPPRPPRESAVVTRCTGARGSLQPAERGVDSRGGAAHARVCAPLSSHTRLSFARPPRTPRLTPMCAMRERAPSPHHSRHLPRNRARARLRAPPGSSRCTGAWRSRRCAPTRPRATPPASSSCP